MSDVASWTDDRVDLLKRLWNDGLSASQIAGELGGVTRNAVIGKVHRLGLSGRAKAPSAANAAARPRKAAATPPRAAAPFSPPPLPRANGSAQPQMRLQPEVKPEPKPGIIDPEVVVPFSERVTIMDLKENMCRWPMGDPTQADFRFCGMKTDTGVPYCTHHCRIAYQPAGERRREQTRAQRA